MHEDTLDPGDLSIADLILQHGATDDPRLGTPLKWAAEVLSRHRSCSLSALVTGPGSCTVLHRSGTALELTVPSQGVDPAGAASAVLARLAAGGVPPSGVLPVRIAGAVHNVTVTPVR